MTRRFRQMQAEKRVALAGMLLQGMTPRAIALALKRSPSTISRELARNSSGGAYALRGAQANSQVRRLEARPAAKLDPDGPLWPLATHMLGWLWSPQQIARTLRTMWPDKPELHVSHETIYTAIYAHPKTELRKDLIACLRQGKSGRKPRSAGDDRRGQIPESVLRNSSRSPSRHLMTACEEYSITAAGDALVSVVHHPRHAHPAREKQQNNAQAQPGHGPQHFATPTIYA
jgi:IS30 family transposase